jgi:hypothetical protein
VILLNLPPTPVVNTLQGLYALAICLSIPLQLFPAIRIVETALFTRSGKNNPIVKWQKNILRFFTVVLSAAIAIVGSSDLDKFVSFIGSLCCVPLCFLFPPLFHYKAIARTWQQKAIDIAIMVFAIVCMTYTTMITVQLWFSDAPADTRPAWHTPLDPPPLSSIRIVVSSISLYLFVLLCMNKSPRILEKLTPIAPPENCPRHLRHVSEYYFALQSPPCVFLASFCMKNQVWPK